MTTTLRNTSNRRGLAHPEMDLSHAKGSEITFDGQTHYVGPNETVSFMDDGIANSLATQSAGGIPGERNATTSFDTGAYSTEETNIKRS